MPPGFAGPDEDVGVAIADFKRPDHVAGSPIADVDRSYARIGALAVARLAAAALAIPPQR